MSYDPKYDQQQNNSSRSAFARLAFNIYGGKPSISPNRTPAFTKSPPYGHSNQTSSSHNFSNSNSSSSSSANLNNYKSEEWSFKGSSEVVAITKLHDPSENVIISAGKNSLQMIQLDNSSPDSPVAEDLLTANFYAKNKKKLGSILDVKSGHQNYSRLVAASTTTGSIFLFNTEKSNDKSKAITKLADHNRAVNVISFNKIDTHLLLSGSQDGSMKLWDLRARNLKPQLTMNGNSDSVRCLQFSPHNSKKFCAVFDSGILQRWDLRNVSQFDRKFNAHTGPGLTLDWNADLDYVATGGRDKQLQIWNMSGNDMRQYPEHVIYASSPIANVSFRPSANPINNIMNADIAISYLNSEPVVQVYSAKRKYVPLYSIENHEGAITALMWESDRYLFTGSKDKTIVKNDLCFHEKFADNLNIKGSTWNVRDEFVFIDQSKNPFAEEDQDMAESHSSNYNNTLPFFQHSNSSNHLSTSPTASPANPPAPENLSGSSFSSSRPQLSRNSSSMRPSIQRDQSHNSHATHFTTPNYNSRNPSHFLIPVELPIIKSEETLRALCESYEFDPREFDLLEICDINSAVASKYNLARDSRTWKVIKESLIWENKHDLLNPTEVFNSIQTNNINTADGPQNTAADIAINSDEYGSEKYHYSTSNSTNYGKSPTLSDMSTDSIARNRGLATSLDAYDPDLPALRSHLGGFKDSAIHEELVDEAVETGDDVNGKDQAEPVELKWCDVILQEPIEEKKSRSVNGDEGKEEEEEKISEAVSLNTNEEDGEDVFSGSGNMIHSEPIPFSMRTARKSISSLLAFKRSSPSLSVVSSLSNSNYGARELSTSKPNMFTGSSLSSFNHTPPTQTSFLTQQLTAASGENTLRTESIVSAANETTPHVGVSSPPFEPRKLIKKCIEFYIDQGDLVMSSTLLLLFNEKFDLFPSVQRDEILFNYLQFLQRLKLWKVFIKFLYLSKLTEVFGNFSNNVKIFCTKCDKLVVNEATKQKFLTDPTIQFGSWYCENCLNIMRCVYCDEPVKKLNISRLKCGHIGHFHCFESWVLNERMVECPGGCL
ncbi:hypothetical protein WICPIJ_007862 [Wickerhamomyces pijperi]|uniref:Restriction of telomere capping protein 1 n=1 Tax=Wickerhamomyces pijperi TaxID=599730 RepID=A0A9P8PZ06_WICPI|nr:hypothetical protein WICPIJ_007862 [Wickerhamomyces pijperi]